MARRRAAAPGFPRCFSEMLTCIQQNKKGHTTSTEAAFRKLSTLKSNIINIRAHLGIPHATTLFSPYKQPSAKKIKQNKKTHKKQKQKNPLYFVFEIVFCICKYL